MAQFKNYLRLLTTAQLVIRFPLINDGQIRGVKRWVAPTLKELRKRKEKMGPEPVEYKKRSNFIEWNYNAELYAFARRLNEHFDSKLLTQAFINRSYILKEEIRQRKLGVENHEINLQDNRELIKKGDTLISNYVKTYLQFSLPKLSPLGLSVFHQWLISDEVLSNISSNIGIKDLALCSKFPVDKNTLVDTFKAVVGALCESSGEVKAYTFVRDFVCTQLNQKDLFEIWNIEKPLEMLNDYCKENNLNAPEPRLIGEIGKNTVLPTYHVGIYLDKKLIGSGYGESASVAVNCAALDTLKKMFGIEDSMKPFCFNIEIEEYRRIIKKKNC